MYSSRMPTATPQPPGFPLALVTGASSGIGREVASHLARKGYRTLLVARRVERLESLAAALSAFAPSTPLPADLSDPRAVEPALRAALCDHGPVSVLINNAGFGLCRPFLEHSEQDMRRFMEVHYFAAAALIRVVLPEMLAQGRGHIINISSISAKMAPVGHAPYAAAKSALLSLTQALAAEHAHSGVRFSCVVPGMVRTEFFDHPSYRELAARHGTRAVEPALVARRIVALLEHPRLEICIPRHYRILDFIKAVSPSWAHRLVAAQSR